MTSDQANIIIALLALIAGIPIGVMIEIILRRFRK